MSHHVGLHLAGVEAAPGELPQQVKAFVAMLRGVLEITGYKMRIHEGIKR